MGRRASLIAVAAALLISGCHHGDPGQPARGSVVPLVGVGFPPGAEAAKAELAGLTVEWGKNWQTYKRENFGRYWSDDTDAPGGRNGCDTRDDVLRRDLTELREGDRNPCVVVSGVLHDPYTGKTLPYSYRRASQIETDHVVALGAAWRAGAHAWTSQGRLEYANDLDVLLAVDKQTNQDKGSRTADKWKPPLRAYWCEYARRYTGIKAKYRLSVTEPEKAALGEMLAAC
ncbi:MULTISPECIES: HNH endonuclease family protein [unclassified Streptomyces]|uniref:HNH endonuclease family protein n=1 Tax=unclassified Streptomyces TaxID=2593676 RepID=UPI0022538C30|nr:MULTISPECIES: HNH endonuclease family protein [unclassified Streptomyces]MCX4524849.1 HNH endonuclease family protein [Streptomyces sp. NBC_01551]MCX4544640.1 HNH endonuclease family protein [Streptomyces sp. NBC_01565]